MTSYVFGIMGFLIAVGTYYFCQKRWSKLSIMDLLVLSYGISFGVYSVVETFIQQNLLIQLDPMVMIMVMFHAVISTIVIWMLLRLMHRKNQRVLGLRYIVQHWAKISESQQLLLLAAIIFPMAYGFFKIGIIGDLQLGILGYGSITEYAPYWYTSIRPLIPIFIYAVALSAAAKISYKRGNALTWAMLLIAFLICMIYGRRQIFYLILLIGIIWYLPRNNLFRFRNLRFIILLLSFLVIFSNIYQTYRKDILSTSINLVESWDDLSATMSNLERRLGPWYLNYLIMESDTMPMFGAFFLQTVRNAIPRVIWPGKVVYGEDLILADHYSLPPIDYPNNPFSTVMADFGILSIFVIPLFYLFVYISASYFLKKFRRFPILYLLLSVMLLQFIMHFETSFYAAFFGLYRYGTVIVILYFIGWGLMKFFKLAAATKLKNKKQISLQE